MSKSHHSSTYKARFKEKSWQKLRDLVMLRDSFQCQICGFQSNEEGYNLQIHHYHYATFGREALEDLVTLCSSCHPKADRERIIKPHVRYKYERP